MPATAPLLEVRGVAVRYGSVEAVSGIDLAVSSGEFVAILGRNGAGKTSLLNGIAGLVPRTGEVRVEGRRISSARADLLCRAGIILVPQGRQLFPTMSVEDNLLLGAFSWTRRTRHALASEQLRNVHGLFPALAERRSQKAGTLSGGQQQMLAIGRALMSRPRVLMLDEPSMGLSIKIAEEMYSTLGRLREAGISILVVEESPERALGLVDRSYVMDRGRIVHAGDRASLNDKKLMESLFLSGGHVG